jgi:hypothetical protein
MTDGTVIQRVRSCTDNAGPDMQFGLFIDDGAGSRRNVMTFTIESKRDGISSPSARQQVWSVPRALITKIIKE